MKKILNKFVARIAFASMLLTFATVNTWTQKKPQTKEQPPAKTVSTKTDKKTTPTDALSEQADEEGAEKEALTEPTVAAENSGAKSSGVKICVAAPKTNLQPAETAPESLLNSLVKYLSGPAAEIVPLEAMVAIQQQAEAVEKGCGFYLAVSLMKKKKGGGEGFGGFLKKASGAAPLLDDLGGGKTAQSVSKAARTSGAKMSTAGDLAVHIKAKDEVTLEYKLLDTNTQANAASGTIKAKARKDGEDILSNLLEQSVNAVLTAALKK